MEDSERFPNAVYSLKSENSTLAFIELSTALDDPFDSFRSMASRLVDTYDATKPCYLFAIPLELRDMISDYTISIGGIQLLQTSKKLREEGTRYLYKRRVCHLDVDLANYVPKFNLQKPIAALIQNVNIDISIDLLVDPRPWIHNIKPMGKFVGAIIPRQTCQVTVHYRHYRTYNSGSILSRAACTLELILSHIRTLVGFSHLILQFTYLPPMTRAPMTRSEDAARAALRFSVFDSAFHQRHLYSDLGPSTRYETIGSRRQYLDFHPRGYWEANPGSMSDETQRLIDRWTGNMKKKYCLRPLAKQRLY
ncbi:hypothetical protein BDR22DRAFT_892106 [Usnea florida]